MKKKYIIAFMLGMGTLTACNDSFLDRVPINNPTEENLFNTYDSFKAFSWPLYNIFSQTAMFGTALSDNAGGSCYNADIYAGYLYARGYKNVGNPYAFGRITPVQTGNGWWFNAELRRANILLSHIDNSEMTQAEKDHWKAIGYFFHSFWYMELIDRFGDVPWVESPLDDGSEEKTAPREDRKAVADRVLDRLIWAEQNIGTLSDGDNTINKECIQALLSRFTLREGTWRKYHELGDYEKYLTECVRVSKELMAKYPNLYTGTENVPAAGYGELWTTKDLKGVPGVILYKEFVAAIKNSQFSAIEHMDAGTTEMSQQTVDLYLCKDGKPIATSDYYHGDKTMYNTFTDRDPRLYHVVMPPYRVVAKAKTQDDQRSWEYTDNPEDRKFIDIMGADLLSTNPGEGMKRLPAQNWSASLVSSVPNLVNGKGATSFVRSNSGYYVWKNWSTWEYNENNSRSQNEADKPIFKIEEVLLNYAEAMYELGQFDQGVAGETINKLRQRAGIADMVVDEITASFDLNRGYWYPKNNTTGIQVDPVLWEIRRERIVELMGEGFGFYDVRRWRMAPWFINSQKHGFWAQKSQFNAGGQFLMDEDGNQDPYDSDRTEGYIWLEPDPIKAGEGWQDRYYLYQIPTQEILLNPNLKPNNPGWEE